MRYALICLLFVACSSDPVTPESPESPDSPDFHYMGAVESLFIMEIKGGRVLIDHLDSEGERFGPGWVVSDVQLSNGIITAWAQIPAFTHPSRQMTGLYHYEGTFNPPAIEGFYWMDDMPHYKHPLNLQRIK